MKIEFPHAGHFIGSEDCAFRRCTYVDGYIVSTVGEYLPEGAKENQSLGVGPNDFYETMVFKAKKNKGGCPACAFVPLDFREVKCQRYELAIDALDGHEGLVQLMEKQIADSGLGKQLLNSKNIWIVSMGGPDEGL